MSVASREILEWFAGQATPVIAMYGRHLGLPIAAAYLIMIPGMIEAVRRLIELCHKWIVMITREERRKPRVSRPEQAFLDELEAAGIKTGDYNLPDWKESREGLRRLRDELFRHSPPTSVIFREASIYIAARTHLADRGIAAPGMSRWWWRTMIRASSGVTPAPATSKGTTVRWWAVSSSCDMPQPTWSISMS